MGVHIQSFGRVSCKIEFIAMKELRTQIDIEAPVAKVWDILTGFENWKNWNPIVNQVSGTATLGSKLTVTMKGKNGKDAQRYMPTITAIDKPKYFRWRAHMMASFMFTNDKVFELEEIPTGTRIIHREEFSGILVPLFWSKLSSGALPMLKSMNEELKAIAEK